MKAATAIVKSNYQSSRDMGYVGILESVSLSRVIGYPVGREKLGLRQENPVNQQPPAVVNQQIVQPHRSKS